MHRRKNDAFAALMVAALGVACEQTAPSESDADLGAGGSGGACAAPPCDGEPGGEGGGGGPLGGVPQGGAAGEAHPGGAGGAAGEGGGEPPPSCAGLAEPNACSAAGCYWWASDETCHEDGPQNPCDQPDAASCGAAGCEWTDDGCLPSAPMGCDGLREVACSARPECRWVGDHCELDPARLPCEQLPIEPCALRNDCAWDGMTSTCNPSPEGVCEVLDEGACTLRRDCQPEYVPDPDCACDACDPSDPGCDPSLCDEACLSVFVGCHPARANCANTPVEACDQTPGCHTEVIEQPCDCACDPADANCACPPCAGAPICVPDAPGDGCEGKDPMSCQLDPRCELTQVEICDGGNPMEPPPDPNGDVPAPAPCVVEVRCLPRQDACAQMPIDACRGSELCHVEMSEICECNGGQAEAPPDDPNAVPIAPPPGDCVCAQVEICLPNGGPVACEQIGNPNDCVAAGCLTDLRWDDPVCAQACAGAGRPACDPADPNCGQMDPIACPDQCFRCFSPAPVEGCFAQAPQECDEGAGCVLFVAPVDCPACDPNAGPCMPCDPAPPICLDLATYCSLQAPETCEQDARCALQASQLCAQPPCGPNMDCPDPVCEDIAVCVAAEAGPNRPPPPPAMEP